MIDDHFHSSSMKRTLVLLSTALLWLIDGVSAAGGIDDATVRHQIARDLTDSLAYHCLAGVE